MSRLRADAPYGADLFRAFMEIITCLALQQEVIKRPGIRAKIETSGRQAQALTGDSS